MTKYADTHMDDLEHSLYEIVRCDCDMGFDIKIKLLNHGRRILSMLERVLISEYINEDR